MNAPAKRDNSGQLFDEIMRRNQLKNDAALCRFIGLKPSHVSKIRHGALPVSAETILLVHEKLGMPVAHIRALLPQKAPAYEVVA
jgi:transcriptional regulator with XRE-family HTH domain